jgi:lipoprotein-releasing system permease protein
VIFFVLLILVIAAAFNVSSTLFISVMQRYSDISVLKTMGATRNFILTWVTMQGVFLGAVGVLLGFGLGGILCLLFMWAQRHLGLIPASVYKLDQIGVEVRLLDMLWIFLATLAICLLSTLAPALRGARMQPVEGLRYE